MIAPTLIPIGIYDRKLYTIKKYDRNYHIKKIRSKNIQCKRFYDDRKRFRFLKSTDIYILFFYHHFIVSFQSQSINRRSSPAAVECTLMRERMRTMPSLDEQAARIHTYIKKWSKILKICV